MPDLIDRRDQPRQNMTPYEARLARLEDKLDKSHDNLNAKMDKISEAISSMARIEERQVAATGRIDRLEFRADEQEKDLDTLKLEHITNKNSIRAGERITWAFVTAFVSGIAVWVTQLMRGMPQ